MKKTTIAVIAVAALLVIAAVVAFAILQSPSPTNPGQLAILGTDPAVTATGVTSASIHYSSVAAHTAGSDMASGWTQMSGSGTLQLTGSAGAAQTIAASQVSAGMYDAFRLNVDSAKVTYHGTEYATTVASTTITAQSQSRVTVTQSAKAAAVVDLRSFVVNTGSNTSPHFIFSASAKATAVPSSAVSSVSLTVGTALSVSSEAWWNTFVASTSTNVNVVATLSGSAMSLTMVNAGSANAQVQEVIVTPVSASATATGSLPASLTGSAVFTVNGTGSAQTTTSLQSAALLSAGATLASGGSTTINYSGNIQASFGLVGIQIGIVSGQQYIVTVIGENTYASAVVVAA